MFAPPVSGGAAGSVDACVCQRPRRPRRAAARTWCGDVAGVDEASCGYKMAVVQRLNRTLWAYLESA
eukprot:2431856-Prymnesium_polylepis.1